MTAPVVSPGSAAPPRAVEARGAGRREEAAQADGTFAALLAAMAPVAPPAVDCAAPAADEPSAPVPGSGAIELLQALTERPQAGLPAPAAAGAPSGTAAGGAHLPASGAAPAAFPVALALPDQGGPAQPAADPAILSAAAAPGGEGGADASGPLGAIVAGGPAPATGPDGVKAAAANVPSGAADGPEAAELHEGPERAGGAEGVEGTPGEALTRPSAEPAARDGAGFGEGGADQPTALRAEAAEGQGEGDGLPAPAPGPTGSAAQAVEAPAARGLERLTAGHLQAQQVVEELSRALPELPDGQYRLTLRLHPEHLGEVRLELHLSGREVHAAMEVASPDARQALESRGDQLRQNLSDAGYNLAGFEVATGEGRQPRRGHEEEPAGWAQSPGRSARPAESAAPAAIQRMRPQGPRGGRLDTMA